MAGEGGIVNLHPNNFDEVLKGVAPVLVDFWAPWCGPCKMIAPILEELVEDYSGRLRVGKVNVDEAQDLAARYEIMSIPTLILFKNGKPREKIVGFRTRRELKKIIDQSL